MSKLTRKNVLAFLNRDWEASRRSKDRALGAHVRAHGVESAFALEQSLLDAVWPRILGNREADLRDHIMLRQKLAKASRVRR